MWKEINNKDCGLQISGLRREGLSVLVPGAGWLLPPSGHHQLCVTKLSIYQVQASSRSCWKQGPTAVTASPVTGHGESKRLQGRTCGLSASENTTAELGWLLSWIYCLHLIWEDYGTTPSRLLASEWAQVGNMGTQRPVKIPWQDLSSQYLFLKWIQWVGLLGRQRAQSLQQKWPPFARGPHQCIYQYETQEFRGSLRNLAPREMLLG